MLSSEIEWERTHCSILCSCWYLLYSSHLDIDIVVKSTRTGSTVNNSVFRKFVGPIGLGIIVVVDWKGVTIGIARISFLI